MCNCRCAFLLLDSGYTVILLSPWITDWKSSLISNMSNISQTHNLHQRNWRKIETFPKSFRTIYACFVKKKKNHFVFVWRNNIRNSFSILRYVRLRHNCEYSLVCAMKHSMLSQIRFIETNSLQHQMHTKFPIITWMVLLHVWTTFSLNNLDLSNSQFTLKINLKEEKKHQRTIFVPSLVLANKFTKLVMKGIWVAFYVMNSEHRLHADW